MISKLVSNLSNYQNTFASIACIRSLSAKAKKVNVKNAIPIPVIIPKKVNVMIKDLTTITKPGEILHHLRYKGRKDNDIAIRNLRLLLLTCKEKKHLSYALKGIKFYQIKGSDFNEEICLRLVNLSIIAEKPQEVAKLVIEPYHRIGAWLSRKANKNLLEALANTNDFELMLNILSISIKKGIHHIQTKDSIELLFQILVKNSLFDKYDNLVDLSKKCINESELTELITKYPNTTNTTEDTITTTIAVE